jgi:hypothetical protein
MIWVGGIILLMWRWGDDPWDGFACSTSCYFNHQHASPHTARCMHINTNTRYDHSNRDGVAHWNRKQKRHNPEKIERSIRRLCKKDIPQKHTTGGIPRWSPTLVLVARFSAYVWQSGRDAQFSLTYGRMYSNSFTSSHILRFVLHWRSSLILMIDVSNF